MWICTTTGLYPTWITGSDETDHSRGIVCYRLDDLETAAKTAYYLSRALKYLKQLRLPSPPPP